ncbi:MAG: MurT ligase domain-containing protein [Oscillospiraceae bacterium]|nr:MurT ligase domain-containing protein [Oscillospiraceae bacterium]
MKVFFAVIICRILYFTGKCIGRGSSLPGKVVLRFFPDVLGRLSLPGIIIAVTGSNGKTSVTELIVHALKESGKSVAWNHEGSNQTEGVATLLLRSASLGGKVRSDAVVMECDERYAKKIFEKVHPTVLLITNLCRDQLTRNGHHEFVADCLRAAIDVLGDGVKLVLNADDPYVSALVLPKTAQGDGSGVLYFGVGSSGDGVSPAAGMYDDGAYCPVCKARMTYNYRIMGHFGDYKCNGCGFSRNKPDIDLTTQENRPLVFMYNFCAAVAVCNAVGIDASDAAESLKGYELKGGRTVSLKIGERKGFLFISKHENSFAYDCSLSRIIEQKKPCTVIVLVDSISRKYYTSETSWLWDINFDLLSDENVKNIVLAGRYANELAARFKMSGVSRDKVGLVFDLSGLRDFIEENTSGDVYAVTCFSDRVKLFKALKR